MIASFSQEEAWDMRERSIRRDVAEETTIKAAAEREQDYGAFMPQMMQDLMERYIAEIKKIYGLYLRRVILYGSYARGDFKADSDVDLMILLGLSDLELKSYSQRLSYMTYDFNLDNDVDIKPIAKSEAHFMKWSVNYPFYVNIQKERVVLYGTA